MNEKIDLLSDEIEISSKKRSPIVIRSVQNVTNINKLAAAFPKELKQIALEDIIEADTGFLALLKRICKMRYNRLLLEGSINNLVVDIDVVLSEYTAFRKRKIIATGTLEQCQAAIHEQINKEFDNKYAHIPVENMDTAFIKNLCQLHWNNPKQFQIIQL